LSYFDKKAVFLGGGDPHRLHLDDMVLIKDNHIALAGSVEKAVRKAKESASFSKKIEVEITRVEDVVEAAEAGADVVMLDNLTPRQIKEAVKALEKTPFRGKVQLEASGGINSKNVTKYASTQVDVMSIGELTHSVKALDISLEIIKPTDKRRKHPN
jgi:nicotinate-nucleotide pyrophosphorylase (carboxylating)